MINIVWVSFVLILVYLVWIYKTKEYVPWQLPLSVILFFVPKINIVRVSEYSSTGIRIDDVIVLLLLISCLSIEVLKNKTIRTGFILLIILSISCIISTVCGVISGYNNPIIYALLVIIRKFEYFSLIISGFYIGSKVQMKTVISHINMLNIGLMIVASLQLIGLCGYAVSGNTSPGFFSGIAVSTFNGYYEYGAYLVFSLIMYSLMLLNNYEKTAFTWALFSLTSIFIVLTKSRSSLLCGLFLIVLIFWKYGSNILKTKRFKMRFLSLTAITLLFVLISMGLKNGNNRFATINIVETVEYLINTFSKANFDEYREMILSGNEVHGIMTAINATSDLSLSIRFFKWASVLNGFLKHPMFGYGFGVTYVIDGNYTRLLGETGLIGTTIWLGMLFYFLREARCRMKESLFSEISYYMIISLCILSILIDMFDASKIMEYMWYVIGLSVSVMVHAPRNRSVNSFFDQVMKRLV